MAKVPVADKLVEKSTKALSTLNTKMEKNKLPGGLTLGLTSSQGPSIGALIGIVADHQGAKLPLSNWGAGTRRMAALEVAAATAAHASITTIDEIERGLEPYRLRKLIGILEETAGQVLTFLAKLAVVGEGKTEIGFLGYLLGKAFGGDSLDEGVRICDGQGNDAVLGLLETMAKAKLECAALVDDEGRYCGRWATLKSAMGDRLLQWANGSTESHVISAVPDDRLEELLTNDEDGLTGYRLRTLAERLGIEPKDMSSIRTALASQGKTLKALMIEAATGSTTGAPDKMEKAWKKHAQDWFKRDGGGEELAMKMIALGAWPTLRPTMLLLINAILGAAGRQSITGLPS
jgi:putative ATP-dependent endonuclease of OLD family